MTARPPLSDLPHHVREQVENLGTGLQRWKEQVRKDPARLLQSTPVRVGCWLLAGAVAYLLIRAGLSALLPPPPQIAEPTPLATIQVACTAPDCGFSQSLRVPMDFSQWPMVCPRCDQPTVYRARLCKACRTWYARTPQQTQECPACAARRQPHSATAPATQPADPDDAEDGW